MDSIGGAFLTQNVSDYLSRYDWCKQQTPQNEGHSKLPLEFFTSTSNISVILNIEVKGRFLETHMGTLEELRMGII